MALDRLTKVDGGGISTTSDYRVGIITATKFVGPIEGDVTGSITATDGTFSGNVTIGGTLTYEDVTNIDSVGIITARDGIHVGAGVSAVGVGTFSGLDISGDIDVDGHTNLDNVSIAGVTTITGSGTALQVGGGTNPHSTKPTVNIAPSSGNAILTLRGGSPTLYFDKTGSGHGKIITDGVNFSIYNGAIDNQGTEVVRIAGSGNVSVYKDLDVDGHTELDNVNIAGVATFSQGGSEVVRINSAGLLVYNDVAFFGASTHAYWDHSSSKFILNDNTKLTLGSSSDYEVYHDGSNAVHRVTGDGDLKLLVEEKNFIVQGTGGHQIIKGIDNGAVELYYNNTKMLETNIPSGHNGEVILGQKVHIRHTGSGNGQIFPSSGNMYVNAKSGETSILCIADGAVQLYHDNTKKFETMSYGAKWTGILLGADNQKLQLGSSGDLSLYHDGTNSYIDNVNTGILRIRGGAGGSGQDIQIQAKNGEFSINAIANGAVELYHDNTKKFETYQYGVKSSGHIVASSDGYGFYAGAGFDIEMLHDGSNSRIKNVTGNLEFQEHTSGDIIFKTTTSGTERLRITSGGQVRLPVNGQQLTWGASQQMKFYYENSEERMYLLGDGAYGFAFRINSGNRLEISKTTGDIIMQGSSGRNFQWDNSEYSLYLTDNGSNSARLKIGSGADLQLYHDVSGNVNHITAATNGTIKISGGVEFWDYTGVTKRVVIDSNGLRTGGVAAPTLPTTGVTPMIMRNATHFTKEIHRTISDYRGLCDGTHSGYLLLIPAYPGSGSVSGKKFYGTITCDRGSSGSGNSTQVATVHAATAYQDDKFFVDTDKNAQYIVKPAKVTYNGTQYLALKFGQSGGGPNYGIHIDGHHRGTDSNFLRIVRQNEIDSVQNDNHGAIANTNSQHPVCGVMVVDMDGTPFNDNSIRYMRGGTIHFEYSPAGEDCYDNGIFTARVNGIYHVTAGFLTGNNVNRVEAAIQRKVSGGSFQSVVNLNGAGNFSNSHNGPTATAFIKMKAGWQLRVYRVSSNQGAYASTHGNNYFGAVLMHGLMDGQV